MEHVQIFFVMAASLIVSAAVIVATVSLTNSGTNMMKNNAREVSQLITVDDSDFSALTADMTGLEVKELIYKFSEDGIYTLTVVEACPEGFYSSVGIEDSTSNHYIKDDAIFTGTIVRNNQDVAVAVQFIEKGMSSVEYDMVKAEESGKTLDSSIAKRQLEILNFAKKNESTCRESIQAFSDWATALQDLENAKMDLRYREVSNTEMDTSELETSISIFKKQKIFYDTLAKTIREDWIPNKWFEPVLKELTEQDLTNEEDDALYWELSKSDDEDDSNPEDSWDWGYTGPTGEDDSDDDEEEENPVSPTDPNWTPEDPDDYDDSWDEGVDFSHGYDGTDEDFYTDTVIDDDDEDEEDNIVTDDEVPIEGPEEGGE